MAVSKCQHTKDMSAYNDNTTTGSGQKRFHTTACLLLLLKHLLLLLLKLRVSRGRAATAFGSALLLLRQSD